MLSKPLRNPFCRLLSYPALHFVHFKTSLFLCQSLKPLLYPYAHADDLVFIFRFDKFTRELIVTWTKNH